MSTEVLCDPFLPSYPIPDDQLGFEYEQLARYDELFPESPLLEYAFDALHRFYSTGDFEDITPEDRIVVDALLTKLELRLPTLYAPQALSEMSDDERNGVMRLEECHIIIGDKLVETHEMLDSLYQLIGAEVIRDDRTAATDGEREGVILRKGWYLGADIYIEERFNELSRLYDGQDTLQVFLLDKTMAEEVYNELTRAERKDFVRRSGIGQLDYLHVAEAMGVTRENYLEIAEIVGAAAELFV